MNFVDAVKSGFVNYFKFSGRASRSEYWWFCLFTLITVVVLVFIEPRDNGVLSSLFQLLILIPSISIGTRRLHDIDKSGWWQLLNFIPLIGSIVLIYWFASKGSDSANRFGENPLGQE